VGEWDGNSPAEDLISAFGQQLVKIISSPAGMQRQTRKWHDSGERVVLVPTMGALHPGHLGLVEKARKLGDRIVVSIYVNPRQFGPREDYSRYPRPFKKDRELCREAGVDVLFAPGSLYAADDSTGVWETTLSRGRCGASRPGHFDGVITVVAKLFLIVQPDVAVFGQKDAQQCDVLERMVRDLHFPVKLVRAPIHRDAKGLAMSSRNAYLSAEQYARALVFPRMLRRAAEEGTSPEDAEKRARRLLSRCPGLKVDYVEWAGGRLCAAVWCGSTRLIDNMPYPARGKTVKVAKGVPLPVSSARRRA
jgi:pantoate--beta-alanine ligase